MCNDLFDVIWRVMPLQLIIQGDTITTWIERDFACLDTLKGVISRQYSLYIIVRLTSAYCPHNIRVPLAFILILRDCLRILFQYQRSQIWKFLFVSVYASKVWGDCRGWLTCLWCTYLAHSIWSQPAWTNSRNYSLWSFWFVIRIYAGCNYLAIRCY